MFGTLVSIYNFIASYFTFTFTVFVVSLPRMSSAFTTTVYTPSRHAFTASRMSGTHGALETGASSKLGWPTVFLFLRAMAVA
jgi:hypothetical protein